MGDLKRYQRGGRGEDIWHFTAVSGPWILPVTSLSYPFLCDLSTLVTKLHRDIRTASEPERERQTNTLNISPREGLVGQTAALMSDKTRADR